MASENGIVTVRMPVEKQKQLEAVAESMDRSRAWVIQQAIDNYLEVYRWQTQEIKAAVKEADGGGTFHSAESIKKMIRKFKPEGDA